MSENPIELKPQVVTLTNLIASENRSIENGLTYPLRFLNIRLHHLENWGDLINSFYSAGNSNPWEMSLASAQAGFTKFSKDYAFGQVDRQIRDRERIKQIIKERRSQIEKYPYVARIVRINEEQLAHKEDYVGSTESEKQLRLKAEEERVLNFIYHAAVSKNEIVLVGSEFDDSCKSCLRGETRVGAHCEAILADQKERGVEKDPKESRDHMWIEFIKEGIDSGKLQREVDDKKLQVLTNQEGEVTGFLITLELLFDPDFHKTLLEVQHQVMERYFPSSYKK